MSDTSIGRIAEVTNRTKRKNSMGVKENDNSFGREVLNLPKRQLTDIKKLKKPIPDQE